MNSQKNNAPIVVATSTKQTENLKSYWPAVFWSCIMLSGSGYSIQQFSALHYYLKNYYEEEDSENFELYFSGSQSIALACLVFFAILIGVLCDIYQPSLVLLVQNFLVVLGQLFVMSALKFHSFTWLFIGQTFVFLWGQTILISSKIYINTQVPEEIKGFVFGLQATSSVVSRGFNLIIDPNIAHKLGVQTSSQICFIFVCVSLIASFFCYRIDADRIKTTATTTTINAPTNQNESSLSSEPKTKNILNQSLPLKPEEEQQKQHNLILQIKEAKLISQWQQVKSFNCQYWTFNFIISASLIVSNVMDSISPAFFSSTWSQTPSTAASTSSIIKFISIIMPAFGILLDFLKTWNTVWLVVGCFLTMLGCFILTFINPIIGAIIFGVGNTMRVSVMFPLLNEIVPKESFGKAFGIIRSCKDLADSLVFLVISLLAHHSKSYQSTFNMISIISAVYFLTTLLFYWQKNCSIGSNSVSSKQKSNNLQAEKVPSISTNQSEMKSIHLELSQNTISYQ